MWFSVATCLQMPFKAMLLIMSQRRDVMNSYLMVIQGLASKVFAMVNWQNASN